MPNSYVLYNDIDRGHLEQFYENLFHLYYFVFLSVFVIVWTSSYVNNLYIVK